MFGAWRTLLALEVVIAHVMGVPFLGEWAVVGFFVLSGFLMTLVMQEAYGYTAAGRGRFAINRALRLLPNYWLSCLLSIVLIAWLGSEAVRSYQPAMTMPGTWLDWLQNATIGFVAEQPGSVVPRLSPATWALTVEMLYYALIAFGISRTPVRSLLWLCASGMYTVAMVVIGRGSGGLYFSIFAGSLPFAVGACLYHYRGRLASFVRGRTVWLFLIRWGLWFGLAALAVKVDLALAWNAFLPLAVLPAAGLVLSLYLSQGSDLGRAIDDAVGRFSYPIYVLHLQFAAAASLCIFGEAVRGLNPRGFVVLAVATPVLLCAIALLPVPLDALVARVRAKMKQT